MHVEY